LRTEGERLAQEERREAPRSPGRAPDLIACLLLVALCLTALWPIVAGRVPLPADALYFVDPAYMPYAPAGVSGPVNTLMLADNVAQMYVWRQHARRSLSGGIVPLWNPYSGCGTPFLANDQSAVLNPTNFALNLAFSPALARTIFVVSCLLMACLFTYGLVRSLGGTPAGGVLGGLTFGLSGFMFLWLGLPLAATAAWFPALLWATHSLAQRPTVLKAVLLGVIIGWQFLSGHLSTSVQMLAFWAVFAGGELLARRRTSERMISRAIALGVLALLLGGLIAAPQLAPLREFVSLSPVSTHGRSRWTSDDPKEALHKGLLGDRAFLASLAPETLALLLLPEWQGNPAFADYRPHPGYGNYVERTSYTGAAGLVALIGGLLWLPRRRQERFFAVAAWVVLGILLHLPVLNLATYIPVLKFAAPQRMRFIFSLCVAVALGLAAPRWLLSSTASRADGRTRPRPVWIIAVLLCILSGALAVLASRSLSSSLVQLSTGAAVLRVAKIFAPAAAAAALAVALLCRARGLLHLRGATVAMVAIVVCDLFVFGARWHVMAARDSILPETPPIRAIRDQAGHGRISGPSAPLRANLAVGYGIYDTRVYDPLSVGRFSRLVEALDGAELGTRPWLTKWTEAPVPTFDTLTSVSSRWEWRPGDELRVRRVPSSLPRAYVTANVRSCTGESALAALAAGHDPREETLIEVLPRLAGHRRRSPGPARGRQLRLPSGARSRRNQQGGLLI
jgi:hypothetical protein